MKTPREVVLLSTSSSIPKPGNRLWILIREASSYFLPFTLAMATVVGDYYTPEEKTQFAAWLQAKSATASKSTSKVAIPALRIDPR